MEPKRLIVLKFGGSILHNEATIRLAVHEIYRWWRDGYQVVAVVSALAGETDRLLGEARRLCDSASAASIAALISTGELRSAALLGLHLDRAGIPTCVLTPGAIGLVATGDPLDARPVALRDDLVYAALTHRGVAVVPGFIAVDMGGRTVVLGRGGSDLSALFLASQLRHCVCRLVKDVDGLYESDPTQPGPMPRRFAVARWEDALATDGSIIQRKAVEFARDRGIEFELGRLNGVTPTRIGLGPTSFGPPDRPTPLRVALLGLGTVGGGVYELLRQLDDSFEIVAVAIRDATKSRSPATPMQLVNLHAIAAGSGADVVIELMGGLEPARSAIEAALGRGAHVVTGNKTLLAEHGRALANLAAGRKLQLRYSASVGGSMPLLERIAILDRKRIRSIRAIINGTTNFVLDRVCNGDDFDCALRAARKYGFAEHDASRDLTGWDAADKLSIIAQMLGANGLRPEDVQREELTPETIRSAREAAASGGTVRHVAILNLSQEPPSASVRLTALNDDDELTDVPNEANAAVIELVDGTQEFVRGRGAGRWPTAESVLADLLELARRQNAEPAYERRPEEGHRPAVSLEARAIAMAC